MKKLLLPDNIYEVIYNRYIKDKNNSYMHTYHI